MRRQPLLQCLLVGLLVTFATAPQALAQERQDLSPVTQFGSSETASTSTASATTSSEPVASQDPNAGLPEVRQDQPDSLLTALYHQEARQVMNLALIETKGVGQVQGKTVTSVNDGDLHYLNQTDSHQLPFTALVKAQDGQVTAAWQAVDDLWSFAVQVMKSQATALKGTVVEQLAQLEHTTLEAVKGHFVPLDSLTPAQDAYQAAKEWQDFYQAVLSDWLASQPQATATDNQQLRYELTGEAAQRFREIVTRHQADYPQVKAAFETMAADYEGTILLDYGQRQIAVGLIQGQVALEYHLDLEPVHLSEPTEAQVLTRAQLTERLGFDWYQGLEQVTQLLTQ